MDLFVLFLKFITDIEFNWFFATIATTSTVFITVMSTFAIYKVSTINKEIDVIKEKQFDYKNEIITLTQINENEKKEIEDIMKVNKVIKQKDKNCRDRIRYNLGISNPMHI